MHLTSDNFSSIDLQQLSEAPNWQTQFRLITQWGDLIHNKPSIRIDQNKINGCETAAWLTHRHIEDRHYFYFDSDSKIIRGLAAIVLSLAEGKTQAQIDALDLENTLQQLGVRKHLTPSRNNGFRAVVERVKTLEIL
jgi:cysteine desulfuration protein SufE